jgi:hypothetical protein
MCHFGIFFHHTNVTCLNIHITSLFDLVYIFVFFLPVSLFHRNFGPQAPPCLLGYSTPFLLILWRKYILWSLTHVNTVFINRFYTSEVWNSSKNSVCTSQETHYVSVTKTNQLMLFREIITTYCENHMKHTNTSCGQNTGFLNVTAGGTYSYHCTLNG